MVASSVALLVDSMDALLVVLMAAMKELGTVDSLVVW